MQLCYYKVDAFTRKASEGNPAACIYLDAGQTLPDALMQRLAREHKGFVSEVAFCTPAPDGSYHLRYYSSECEVDFCGHATIACMHTLLRSNAKAHALAELCIHTRRGSLTVYNELETLDAVFIEAPQPQDCTVRVTAQTLAQALDTPADSLADTLPVQAINAGLSTLLVPFASLAGLLALNPDMETLKSFCQQCGVDIVLVFSTQVADTASLVRTRVFAPRFGYLEDPATGSGNAALGYYLLRHTLWDGGPAAIEQNNQHTLYNQVWLKTRQGKVLFGGRGTVRIAGHYLVDE